MRATPSSALHRLVSQSVRLRDGRVQAISDATTLGLAVRVIVDGTWGFASAAELSPDVAAATARTAVEVATTLRALNRERVELADEPVYADVEWVSPYEIDPFTVPTHDKVALLGEYSGRLSAADGVDHVTASLDQVKEQMFYADTAGSRITQQRVRLQPQLEADRRRSGGGAVRDDAHARAAGRAGIRVSSPAPTACGTGATKSPASRSGWRRR